MIRLVERIGRVLEAFTLEQPELTLTECARAADLNKSSAYRLLTSLEEIGLVERRATLWRIGARPILLATVRLGQLDLRIEAVSYLKSLRQRFQAAVAFSVPDGSDMIYLERMDSPDAFGVSARLGARAPMWAGGSGKAVLSRMPAAERMARLDVPEWQTLPSAMRTQVLAEVERAAGRGYAIDHGEFFDGIGGVAAAVIDLSGSPIAALSVIVPRDRLTGEVATQIGQRLIDDTNQLAVALGKAPMPAAVASGATA